MNTVRLIDADELENRIRKRYCEPCKVSKGDYDGVHCRACATGDMLDDIEDEPTVYSVKHGHWILGKCFDKCSVCGWLVGLHDDDNADRYCSHCGAKMDEPVSISDTLEE